MHERIEQSLITFGSYWVVGGFISTILTRRIITRLNPKEYSVTQWHTQAGNITTNLEFKIDVHYLNVA